MNKLENRMDGGRKRRKRGSENIERGGKKISM
jgi:hypothetical protein